MPTISSPAGAVPERKHWHELLAVEVWASLAITMMWVAVAIAAVWGPDFVSTSGSGASSTTIPSAIFVAIFAWLGTWALAKYAFARRKEDDR